MTQYTSVCPYDCPDACGLVVDVEGGRVVSVKGDESHPFTRGTMCPKMAHYERTVYSPRRLTTPLKRTGPKGSGKFEPISWDQALAEIAASWEKNYRRKGTGSHLAVLLRRHHGHRPARRSAWLVLSARCVGTRPDDLRTGQGAGVQRRHGRYLADGAPGSAKQRRHLLVEHSHDGHQYPLQARRRRCS